ncbi:MAG: RNA polymerase sigma factor [Gammaproteobacteria bacterium]|nr:RNA polymerase sigma factor [Gammaproteobacteria bacterium]
MRDDDVLAKNPLVSQSALEAIHDQVFGWALSRCDYDRNVAEDLVQQTYVELLTGKAKFEQRSTLKTFVFSVVQNLAKSRYRRQASRLRLISNVKSRDIVEHAEVAVAAEYDALWGAVKALPQRQRDILELVFCRELTIDEASAVMGVTTGTGRVHYDRAKKALRARLQDQQDVLNE